MENFRNPFIAFVLAVCFLYTALHSAKYVQIFYPDNIHVMGSLLKYRVNCSAAPLKDSICTDEFVVPIVQNARWIGAGRIISSSEFLCETGEVFKTYDDPTNPGTDFSLFNNYQTAEIPKNCKNTITIRAWSRKSYLRWGYLGGQVAQGSARSIEAVKKLHDFFSNGLITAFTIIFATAFFLKRRVSSIDPAAKPFFIHALLWVAFFFFASNTGQDLFPYFGMPLLFNKLVAITSACSHLVPVLYVAKKTITHMRNKVVTHGLVPFLLLGAASPYFAQFLIASLVAASFLSVFVAKKEKNFFWFFYSFAIILSALSILNFRNLPGSMLTGYFIGAYTLIMVISLITKESIHSSTDLTRSLHDIISPVRTLSDYAKSEQVSPRVTNAISVIENSIYNLLPEKSSASRVPTQVRKLINEACEMCIPSSRVRISPDNDFNAILERTSVTRCLINIITNAAESCDDVIDIKFRKQKKSLVIEVIDQGPGFNGVRLKRTTKKNGSGLGIDSTKEILRRIKGRLSYIPGREKGTTAVIEIELTNEYIFLTPLSQSAENLRLVERLYLDATSNNNSDSMNDLSITATTRERVVEVVDKSNAKIIIIRKMILIEDDKYIAAEWKRLAAQEEINLTTYSVIPESIPKCDAVFLDRYLGNQDTTDFGRRLAAEGVLVFSISSTNRRTKEAPWQANHAFQKIDMYS